MGTLPSSSAANPESLDNRLNYRNDPLHQEDWPKYSNKTKEPMLFCISKSNTSVAMLSMCWHQAVARMYQLAEAGPYSLKNRRGGV